jgi:hypothetical protein
MTVIIVKEIMLTIIEIIETKIIEMTIGIITTTAITIRDLPPVIRTMMKKKKKKKKK